MCWGYGPKEGAQRTNTVQKYLIENTRLGIPVIFHGEGLHGYQAVGATHFPQAIALASTWDPALHERIFTAVAQEMRARGESQVFTPLLDLARDPRWGRTERPMARIRTSSRGWESPASVASRAKARSSTKTMSSRPSNTSRLQPARARYQLLAGNYSERVIRENFLKTFQAAITEAGAMSVMPSYNEVDGIPSHANRQFLQKILREEWGFEGIVVSDYGGIGQLYSFHFVAHGPEEAAKKALEAGVDIELPDIDCYGTLIDQVRNGTISEAVLDRAVARILRAKFLLGLFDNPYVDPDRAVQVTNCQEHRDLALLAAHKAAVLLKNEGRLLPLDRKAIKKLAVIGPNAGDVHLGGYSWEPRTGVSILDGIRAKVGGDIDVRYAEGCRITEAFRSGSRTR